MNLFKLFLFKVVLLLTITSFHSCQTDNTDDIEEQEEKKEDETPTEEENTLTVTDLNISINENLDSETTIETISATTTTGTITYTIKSSTAEGSVKIESDGTVKIDDNALIDYETHTEISLVVTVSNGTDTKDITITIAILDVDETVEEETDIILGEMSTVRIKDTGDKYEFGYNTKAFESLTFFIKDLPLVATTYEVTNVYEEIDYVEKVQVVFIDKEFKGSSIISGTLKINPLGNDRYSVELTNLKTDSGTIKFIDYAVTSPVENSVSVTSGLHGDTSDLPTIIATTEKVNDTYFLEGVAKKEAFVDGKPFVREFSITVTLPKGHDITDTTYEVATFSTDTKARVTFIYKSTSPTTTIKTYYASSGTVNITRNGDKFTVKFTNLPTVEFKNITFEEVDNLLSAEYTGVIKN